MMLMVVSPYRTAVFLARIVMPFSRSRSIESITRSRTESFSAWCSVKAPDCQSMASTSVVLPWSTWAMIAMLRRSSLVGTKRRYGTAALPAFERCCAKRFGRTPPLPIGRTVRHVRRDRRTRLGALFAAPVILTGVVAVACTPLPGAPNCSAFPDDNIWHADISKLPVDTHSAAWLAATGATSGRKLHPDFGPSENPKAPYGIPVTTVAGSHAKVPVRFDYADESDRVPYPLGSDITLESGGDAHAIIVDRDACKLYETWDTRN